MRTWLIGMGIFFFSGEVRAVRNVYSVAGLNRFVLLTDFRTHTRLKNGQKLKTNSPSFSFIHWLALYWKKVFVRWKWQRRPKGLKEGKGFGGWMYVTKRGDVKRTNGRTDAGVRDARVRTAVD